MAEENISLKFRLKNIEEAGNYIIENDFIGKIKNKICTAFNYIEHLLILASVVTGSVSIFAFASSV